jgi:hypothetical protein
MLYTIANVSELTNLSKVSIYKKLKLKELQGHFLKKQGITYIDEVGLNLIQDSLKLKEKVKTGLKEDKEYETENEEKSMDKDDLNLKNDYINHLKDENSQLWQVIKDQSRQLENFQVMLQTEKQTRLQLEAATEERVKKLDTFITEWQQDHQGQDKKKDEKRGFFKRLFK